MLFRSAECDFRVPVYHEGDVYARYRVHMEEMRESVKIIGQALEGLPEGPHIADERKFVLPPRSELSIAVASRSAPTPLPRASSPTYALISATPA